MNKMKIGNEEVERRKQRPAAVRQNVEAWNTEELVDLLGGGDWETSRAAWHALFARGKATLDALVAGLSHPSGRVRADCALLMDHLGDDRCVEPLRRVLRGDPLEAVRRCALHSLACQDCKECPLNTDVTGPIIEAALTDRSVAVRRRAAQYLVGQRPDARVVAAMKTIQETQTDPILLRRAGRALRWHEEKASPIG